MSIIEIILCGSLFSSTHDHKINAYWDSTIISVSDWLVLGLPLQVNAQGTTTNTASSNSLKGALTSIQNDPTDESTSWIVSGVFRMDNMSGAAPSSTPTFNSSFYMVKTDWDRFT